MAQQQSGFSLEEVAPFESATSISGVPITSASPLNNQYLAYDAAINEFVYLTAATGGANGPQGPQGLQGPQGPPGPMGQIGPDGPTGPAGDPGPAGFIGINGVRGSNGVVGITGPIGTTGATGATGPNRSDPWAKYDDPKTTAPGIYYFPDQTPSTTNFVYGDSTEGAGTKMFVTLHTPSTDATSFRCGMAVGTEWNYANRGQNSFACGSNVTASSLNSAAIGSANVSAGTQSVTVNESNETTTNASNSFACGLSNKITCTEGFACGSQNEVGGFAGNACFGNLNKITGTTSKNSLAIGLNISLAGSNSFVYSLATTQPVLASNSFVVNASGDVAFFSNTNLTSGVRLVGGGATSWSSICDRNNKIDLVEVDYARMLDALLNLPSYVYDYVGDESASVHVGPVAQDWHASVFPASGKPETHIDSGDVRGVLMAAVRQLPQYINDRYDRMERDVVTAQTRHRELCAAR